MTIKKIQIIPPGYTDILHPETDSTVVLMGDGSTLEAKFASLSFNASGISVTDTGNYYTSTNVEGNLQEIGLVLSNMRGNLITTTNALLGM